MGRRGLEQPEESSRKSPVSASGAAKGAAVGGKKAVQAGQGGDFAAALAMIAHLPLSPVEKAEAVRRLLSGQEDAQP